MKILLLVDMYNWSFHNIAKKIKSHITNYTFDIISTCDFYNNIRDILPNKYDIFVFFFPSPNFTDKQLDFIKKFNNSKIYFCLYENFIWRKINKIPSLQDQRINTYDKIKFWLKSSDGYFYASPHIKKSLNKNFKRFPKPNDYCMDGVDTKIFKFKEYKNDILTKKILKIGWIGDSNPKVSGIQKGYREIKQYIEDLSGNFDFCPLDKQIKQIPHNEVPEYIHNIDIIVCYSTCEGTPNQILESSSCGRCWVSTDVGIVNEVYNTFDNNPTGIIIKKDEESFKSSLMKLYNNRQLIIDYGENGRKAIEKKWDWKDRLESFKKMFEMN